MANGNLANYRLYDGQTPFTFCHERSNTETTSKKTKEIDKTVTNIKIPNFHNLDEL